MIEIKNEAFAKGKEMMKKLRADNQKEIRRLEKITSGKGRRNLTEKEFGSLEWLKRSIPIYSVSKVLPVKYGGLIINGKLLKAYVKKLKGFEIKVQSDEEKFILRYGKERGKYTGRLELYDLSEFFQGFPNIPELVVK